MINLGILCGGNSAEHEISLLSAKNVLDAVDRSRFSPVIIGIEKSGRWLLENENDFLINPGDPRNVRLNPSGIPVTLAPASGGRLWFADAGQDAARHVAPLDVILPILHGPFGEDGTVQGLLKLAGVPFAGAGVLGSAVGMDKDVSKRLVRDAGLPGCSFFAATAKNLSSFKETTSRLGLPFFVKPANMGSSVGVFKVHNETEWRNAVKEAFFYDVKLIFEEFIAGREIECAVLDVPGAEPIASVLGEVRPLHEFYSYDAKYLDDNGAALDIPARLPAELSEKIRTMAAAVFKTLCCEGLARVDFFVTKDEKIFVNEINTMPGFTRISMYPKLFAECGIDYTNLISRVIDNALKK